MGLPRRVPGGSSPLQGQAAPPPRVPHLQPQSRETTWARRQAVNSPGMACPLWVLLTQQKMKLAFLWVLTRWGWGLSSSPTRSPLQPPGSTVKSLGQGGTMGPPQMYSTTSPLNLPTQQAGSFSGLFLGEPINHFHWGAGGDGRGEVKKDISVLPET